MQYWVLIELLISNSIFSVNVTNNADKLKVTNNTTKVTNTTVKVTNM
jgi:hypothetical protein